MKNDPGEFAGPETRLEPFEALEFVHDRVRHPEPAAGRADLQGVGQEPEHTLLVKTAFEAAHRFWMGAGFLRALRRGAFRDEQQRADEFITILRWIRERELGCLSLGMGPHW